MERTIKEEALSELLPAPGDPGLGEKAWGIFEAAFNHKNHIGLPDKWRRNYELGRNLHWKQKSTAVPLISANFLHAHRQRIVNSLTDQSPTFEVIAEGDVSPEYRDLQLRVTKFWWQESEQQSVLERSILNGETYGCTIEKMIFNADIEFGVGDVETEVVDPFHFAFTPVDCMDIQKADAVFHYRPFSLRQVRRLWPESSEEVVSDSSFLGDLGRERIDVNVSTGAARGIRGKFAQFGNAIKEMLSTSSGTSVDDELLVVEMWFKDYSVDEEGNYLYPGGIRRIQMCNGGRVILSDMGNPSINPMLPATETCKTYLFDKYPFSFTQSNTDTANPWGNSDYEQLEGIQIEIDKTLSQITLLKDRTARLKIINPRDSGVDNSAFTNAPGIIMPSSHQVAAGIRYLDFPKVPMDLTQILTVFRDMFFTVAGSFELEQANAPGQNVIAFKAIAALLERAATMHKGKIRNYTKMIRHRGRMFISLAQNWYTEDRYISWEDKGEIVSKSLVGKDLIVPAKLSVISGSTMPVSRLHLREEAISLYQMGGLDVEELLKRLEWPDWSKVAKRMSQGPVGEFIEKLEMAGMPPTALDAMRDIASKDMREFEADMYRKRIPDIKRLVMEDQAPQDGQEAINQASVLEIQAKVEELKAKTMLIAEQAKTEQVEQQVKLAGVKFDQDKLNIEKAITVANVRKQADDSKINKAKFVVGARDKNGKDRQKIPMPDKEDRPKAVQKTPGPYRERGVGSNNA